MPGEAMIFAAAFRAKYYRLMFLRAALWNALAAVAVLLPVNKGSLRAAPDAVGQELLAACLATFGLGYYWVSRDLSKNRELPAPQSTWVGVIPHPCICTACCESVRIAAGKSAKREA